MKYVISEQESTRVVETPQLFCLSEKLQSATYIWKMYGFDINWFRLLERQILVLIMPKKQR